MRTPDHPMSEEQFIATVNRVLRDAPSLDEVVMSEVALRTLIGDACYEELKVEGRVRELGGDATGCSAMRRCAKQPGEPEK